MLPRTLELISLLHIRDLSLGSLNPQAEINACVAAATAIWKETVQLNFTNHDLSHSQSVIDHFLALNSQYNWGEYESLVFGIASLVHDVGMQYNYWAPLPTDTDAPQDFIYQALGTGSPPLSDKEVRKQHVHHGTALIQAEVQGKRCWSSILPFSTGSEVARTLLNHACYVAFAHSDGRFWEQLQRPDDACYRSHPLPGGNNLRLRLLAGTLRICDELDGNYGRLADPERLWEEGLSELSRLHWLACHYVTSSTVTSQDKEKSVSLRVSWRVPVDSTADLHRRIKDFLEDMRIQKIKSEVKLINAVYENAGEGQFHLAMTGGLDAEPSEEFVGAVTPELEDMLSKYAEILDQGILAYVGDSTTLGMRESIQNAASRPVLLTGEIATEFQHPPSDSVETILRNWYRRNKSEKGHFQLASGVHTNVLVRCRALVSDRPLMNRLASYIAEKHKERDIRTVLGIGQALSH